MDAAFTATVRRLFPVPPPRSRTAGLARRAAARCRSPRITADEITALIRAEAGDLGPRERFTVQLAALPELAEEYGLLREIHELALAAEETALRDGRQPALADA